MSSRTVEREIVQMEFDARKFSQGVGGATKELGAFKKQFDMGQQEKSLQHLERTANGIQFDGMQQGIQSVTAGFSAMQIVAFTVINRITNAILDMGKKLFNTIAVEPLKTGLEEYELQLNSVQTILANTASKGTTLEDVNNALDELNKYADLTIYNFGQMTNAIGRFTTAGIELDTAVMAIKGFSNVAAISGANAEEAARGQYQLSQALAAGTIRLMDWRSIENANMGGQVFKDSLIETARLHGVHVDKMIEKNGSFQLSLQEGWLTAEIMLETLNKFTGEMSDEQLLAMGYTEEQVAQIQETAKLALDAATKIKTVTQLIDVLKEAMQSGWAQSWRTIFGDFNEARELWGQVAEILTKEIEAGANERNKQLEFWAKVGGRAKLVDALLRTLKGIMYIVNAFQNAIGEVFGSFNAGKMLVFSERILEMSKAFQRFGYQLSTYRNFLLVDFFSGIKAVVTGVINIVRAFAEAVGDIFKGVSGSKIVELVSGFRKFAEGFRDASENLETFKRIVRGVAAVLDIVIRFIAAFLTPLSELINNVGKGSEGFWEWLASIADWIVAWREMAIETDLFNKVAADVVAWIEMVVDRIQLAVDQFLELEVVQDVIGWFQALTKEDLLNFWNGLLTVLSAIVAPFYLAAEGARLLWVELQKLEFVQEIIKWFEELTYTKVKDWFRELTTNTREFFDSIRNSEIVAKMAEYFATFDGRRFLNFQKEAGEHMGWLSTAADKLREAFGKLDFTGVGEGFKKVGEAVKGAIIGALDWLIENADSIDYSAVFKAINTGLFAGLLIALRKIASGEFLSGIFGDDSPLGQIKESLVETLGGVQGVLTSYQTNIKADTLQKIAISIAIFAGAILLLTFVDSEKLTTVTAAIVAMLGALFGSTAIMSKIDTRRAITAAAAIIGIAIALTIAAVALALVSELDPERITSSLEAMGKGLAGLVGSILVLGQGTSSLKAVAALNGLAVGLILFSFVLQRLGAMEPEVLAQGIEAIALMMGILVGSIFALSKVGDKGLITTALTLGDMAIALVILAQAVANFGGMDPDVLAQGLYTIGIALAGFALYSRIVQPKGMIQAAIGLTILSGAMILLGEALKIIGGIDQDELIRALIGMGVALLILVVAANAMTGAIGGAIAMIIMSVALIAIAGALKVLSTLSLAELGIALLAIAGVFVVLGLAALVLTPLIPVLLALGIALALIGVGAALLGVAVFLVATGLVALAAAGAGAAGAITLIGLAVINLIPQLATALAEGISNFIIMLGEKAPELKEAFKSIIISMITGITELVPEIATAVLTMITQLIDAFQESDIVSKLSQAGFDILIDLLTGIEENIGEVVTRAIAIVTQFIDALGSEEGLSKIVTGAFKFILDFLTAVDEAVVQYTDQIISKGIDIGVHILEGVAKAIENGAPRVRTAVWALVQAALDALGLGFITRSPSKATAWYGEMAVQGLVLALSDGVGAVRRGMAILAETAVDGMNPFERALADAIENEWEFSPVITPVVDLGNVSEGARLADSLFRDVIFGSEGQDSDYDSVGNPQDPRGGQDGVTFIQNNYSPKALDNATLYRQTRTLVATRSRKAFEK